MRGGIIINKWSKSVNLCLRSGNGSEVKTGEKKRRKEQCKKKAKAPSQCFCLADCTRARIYGYAEADMTPSTLGCAF